MKTDFSKRSIVFVAIPAILLLISLTLASGSARAAQFGAASSSGKPVAPAAANSCSTLSFAPAVNYTTGPNPSGVVVADLNSDGRPDIATSNNIVPTGSSQAGSITALLSNSNGAFSSPSTFSTEQDPSYLVSGDFNGDHNIDLVNNSLDGVDLFLGNGNGTFGPMRRYDAGSSGLGAGDFNGDGKLDLISGNSYDYTVVTLSGDGAGGFSNFNNSPKTNVGHNPLNLAVGDLSGDGKLDVAIVAGDTSNSNNGAYVTILLGKGDGSFQAAHDFATAGDSYSVALGDFNGDGKLDIATSNAYSNASVLLGNGDGTFQTHHDYATGSIPRSIAVGDMNGDGKLDLIVGNGLSYNVSILLGNGDGTFQSQATFATSSSGHRGIAVADFNGDGQLDIATSNSADSFVSVLLNNCAAGTTNTPTTVPTHTATGVATHTATSGPTNTPTVQPTPTIGAGCISSDVCPSDYWFTPVQYLEAHGAISGYSDQTFRPFNNATRGQLAKIVVIAESIPQVTPSHATFTDVPVGSTFFTYIESAVAKGIISGYDTGNGQREFRPGNNVTRGQIAKIIVVAAGWALVNPSTATFTDVAVGSPFYQVIESAVAHGIISGYALPNGMKEFRPGANATRGQIAKIVYLALPHGSK